jgi:ATP synthase protein I
MIVIMNSTLFKNHPSKNNHTHSTIEGDRRQVYKLGIQVDKPKYHGLQHKIRKFGELGWVIAVPTVLGAALGLWLDTLWPSDHSWFRILLPTGTFIGCLTAIIWGYQDQGP